MAQLLVDVTPFKPTIREAKGRPGVFEVEGIMQRALAENQNGRVYKKDLLAREAKKYVEEFVKKAFDHVNLNYKDYVIVDKNLIRPTEVDALLANYSKAKKVLKWEPKISFDNLISEMVESDLEFVTNFKS